MTGLVAFLGARFDELERRIIAEHGGPGFFWSSGDRALTTEVAITGPDGSVWPQWRDVPPKAAFWLADIAAKRQIIARYESCLRRLDATRNRFEALQVREYEDFVLLLLAAPFAGHPDFDPAWAVPMS